MIRPGMILVAVAALASLVAPAAAALSPEQRTAILREAQTAYDRGVNLLRESPGAADAAFREAAARFEQLAADGLANAALEYNLGNAWLQAGDVGRAILHYRRSERLDPGRPELAHNLEYARSLRRDRFAVSGDRALADALLGWHRRFDPGVRLGVFVVAWLAFWGVLAWSQVRRVPGLGWLLAALAVAWALAGASIAAEWIRPSAPAGVLLADDVVLRKGNGDGFEPRFAEPLGAGVEFTLRERRGDWLHVELPDGHDGWVRAEQAAIVFEPSVDGG